MRCARPWVESVRSVLPARVVRARDQHAGLRQTVRGGIAAASHAHWVLGNALLYDHPHSHPRPFYARHPRCVVQPHEARHDAPVWFVRSIGPPRRSCPSPRSILFTPGCLFHTRQRSAWSRGYEASRSSTRFIVPFFHHNPRLHSHLTTPPLIPPPAPARPGTTRHDDHARAWGGRWTASGGRRNGSARRAKS